VVIPQPALGWIPRNSIALSCFPPKKKMMSFPKNKSVLLFHLMPVWVGVPNDDQRDIEVVDDEQVEETF
jgi:hypothetical protein